MMDTLSGLPWYVLAFIGLGVLIVAVEAAVAIIAAGVRRGVAKALKDRPT